MPWHSALTAAGSALAGLALAVTGAPQAAWAAAPADHTSAAVQASAAAHDESGHPGPETRVIAHRGASGHAPENTAAAVEAAAELGIRWVELDVQRTRDGELVAFHDATLQRTTDAAEVFPDRAPWVLGDFTSAELARLDAGSWFGEGFAGEPVPELGALLDQLRRGDQRLLLELKAPELYPGIEKEVLDTLADHGWLAPHRVRGSLVVQSFDAESVRTVHALDPRVKTGFLGRPPVGELAWYAEFADQINPRYTEVTGAYLDAVKALRGPRGRPLEMFVWTVNDAPSAVALAELGVDGIITDLPDVIREALDR